MITERTRQVLQMMADAEDRRDYANAELVCEGLECYVGLERTSRSVVNTLLRLVLVRCEDFGNGSVERYTINADGRKMLADPNYVPEIVGHMRKCSEGDHDHD